MMVLTVLLALVFGVAEPQTLQTPDPNRVEDVRVTGNRRIPSETIKYQLQTKPNDRFSMDVIRADMKRLYAQGHFDDIRVDEEQGKTGRIIIFTVKEKKTIRSVKYEGLNSITNSEIRNNIISVPPSAIHIAKDAPGPIGLVVRNNLYWPSPVQLTHLADEEPFAGDPQFVNPDSGDFHLQAGSAAMNRGRTLADVPNDKDGKPRTTSTPDLGAYEY